MEGALKNLDKLSGPPSRILDELLDSFYKAKSDLSKPSLLQLKDAVDNSKKSLDQKQKDAYNALARIGKALDKKFTASLPTYPPLFSSPESTLALERTIALHWLRSGQFTIAETFLTESAVHIEPEERAQFMDLHRILQALRNQDVAPALQWAASHIEFLKQRGSSLPFNLHRSQYIRLLLSSHPPDTLQAIAYANASLRPFYATHRTEIEQLMASVAYLPLSRLQTSPYAHLASPSLHFDLEPLFAQEYCAQLGLSRQIPLRVVGDIGGGGALSRIEKGRKVMQDRGSEVWSQTDELRIEIPLPAENRYHSIFACPVSKEQSTDANPPTMLSCGHVLNKDSMHKLAKPGAAGRLKCPYCPMDSTLSSAMRLYL